VNQRNDLAEKKIVKWDGEEILGLVHVSEIPREKGTIEVGEFNRVRVIQNGVQKMPEVTMIYKIQRANGALEWALVFFEQDQTKDCEIIRTDAAGVEFSRTLLQSCECKTYTEPEYEAGNPTFAKLTIVVLPFEIIGDSGA
jgi:hypothetical protein